MLETKQVKEKMEHSFSSHNREGIKIGGVLEVMSFDASHVQMNTTCGRLIIEGENLIVSVLELNSGTVEVAGNINGVFYPVEGAVKKRLFGKNK